jgi:WD40 repeat protein
MVAPLPLPAASFTEEFTRTDETEAPWPAISSSGPASVERGTRPDRPPPLEGFIKHYEIIRKLGEGGMGIVLLARDTKLGRLVAIKLLQESGRATSRLLAEARATASCRHDSIVVIHDVDEIDGYPYMVLEYLEGRTLREVLPSGAPTASRALPKGPALDIVTSVVRALAAAHERAVVHRDLKPENIMILDTGGVKVLDFGIARHGDSMAPRGRAGTLPYMAPEQWLGDKIDARTDLWAVGVLLYELLAGAHPLAPVTMQRLESVADMDAPMPRLRDLLPELAALSDIVERCLRKRMEERFGSAEELLSALEPLREGGRPVALAEGELPFAGLSAFQESNAGRFFGRERDIAAVVGRLRRQRLVTVAGPSGAGKSSFIRAGVIPALKRSGEDWDVLVLRPGRAPVSALGEALAEALAPDAQDPRPTVEYDFHAEPGGLGARLRAHCRARGPHSRALVFVDQFEELYTLVSDPEERAAFIRSLLAAADEASSPLRVILSIRSDFLDRVADDRQFMAEVTAGLFLLPPVGREGLREALLRPVEAAGHRFESEAMITDILDELSRAKTPLPLLQFSAAELWEARDRERKSLTRGSYERLGGVAGSLSTHAEAVFAGLSPSDQLLCQTVFLRLVTPERTRAIVSMPELASLAEDHAAAEALVQRLCGARLLLLEIGGEGGSITVELVHESLIERWPRLARWLDESTADAQFLARLRAAASQWQASGEVDGLLWRDRAAEQARAWYERQRATPDAERDLPLGRPEERYLLSVIALFERARRRRQRSIAGAFAFLGAVSVLVFFLAMRAQTNARRADAEAAQVKEQNGELAFQALRGRNAMRMLAARKRQDDPTLALALLREVEPADIPKDWPELVSAAFSDGVARAVQPAHGPAIIYAATVSPDGGRIVTASHDKTARVLSFDGLRELASLRGHDAHVWSAAFSPDGSRVVTASGDGTARIWNADGDGKPLVLRGHEASVNSAAWSPDGALVVTASDDRTARVFRAIDAVQLLVIRHDADVNAAAFSPDGGRIVTASADGIARVWDADGQGAPLLLRGHQGMVVAAAFRPDGKRVATAGLDRTVRVWDPFEGTELFALRGHEDKVMSVAWSPDGKRIASACKDGVARVFRADGEGDPMVLRGHKHWVYTAMWSPDNRHLVTASLDTTLRVWDLDGVTAPVVLRGYPIRFSPNGDRIAMATADGTVRVWTADDPAALVVLRGQLDRAYYLDFSPDGTRIASACGDNIARIWRTDGSPDPIVRRDHPNKVVQALFSPSGDRLATASVDGTVYVSRADGSGEPLVFRAPVRPGSFMTTRFDPGGRRLLIIADSNDTSWVWSTDGSGKTVALTGHEGPIYWAQWSPDGSRVATASADHTARIWDVDGARAPVVLRGHEGTVASVEWHRDGHRVVTASNDRTARVWNADGSGQPLVLRGHEDKLSRAAWSPDGARIVTASNDRTARVWNADGSGQAVVLGGASVGLTDAFWSPDGARIVTQSDDGVARLWRDARPISGPEDPQSWEATTYCIPIELRVALLQVTQAEARAHHEACERRVEQARTAGGDPDRTPSRDVVRP